MYTNLKRLHKRQHLCKSSQLVSENNSETLRHDSLLLQGNYGTMKRMFDHSTKMFEKPTMLERQPISIIVMC